MVTTVDVHIGKRLRRRRRLLGMTQQQLAESVGVRFQQIQKYECGANRVTAARLYELARAIKVPVQYFFDGLTESQIVVPPANDLADVPGDVFASRETLELVRAYYRLGERPRRRLLDVAKALEADNSDAA
jgi:transcriptional regulator with XRE-family HTH domain